MIATIGRIGPEQAKKDLASGALLICAYDSDEKFRKNRLNGAVSLAELQSQETRLSKDRELIFYCA